jgi:hypothetical protein
MGNFKVTGANLSGISYVSPILTINGNGTYTISMKDGLTSTNTDRIVVASGVNADITLFGVDIDLNDACAFSTSGATVNLTLVGDNVLSSGENNAGLHVPNGSTLVITAESNGTFTVSGGQYAAGIGGSYGEDSGNISIKGGTIIANAGYDGAGIGGGTTGYSGAICITGGTVTATGGIFGAGIGGGSAGGSYSINITGGIVTATSSPANGIGGGYLADFADTIVVNNNAVVFASTIQPTLIEGENVNNSIIFIDNDGTLYGDVVLGMDVTFADELILTIENGKSLTIPNSITLTNNGTINNNGTIIRNGLIAGSGTINGKQPE